jgi:hypothetical protein
LGGGGEIRESGMLGVFVEQLIGLIFEKLLINPINITNHFKEYANEYRGACNYDVIVFYFRIGSGDFVGSARKGVSR